MTQIVRGPVGPIRREQIVDAAVAVIAEQGIQHLSLSEIEKRAGMTRGQLTYYFRTKEDILLAIFDRLLQMMRDQAEGKAPRPEGMPHCEAARVMGGWERLQFFLRYMVTNPPPIPWFHPLQYTFLSQIAHREDFRQRLAGLYEEWRRRMTADLEQALRDRPASGVSARTVASFVQAVLHGLSMQRAADPEAFDRQEMVTLILDLLGNYLGRPPSTNPVPPVNGEP